MQDNMQRRLIQLITEAENNLIRAYPYTTDTFRIEEVVQHLLLNGVVVVDNDVVSPENRPLIQTVANTPIDEVITLVKAKQEGRVIVPPCKVGDTVYDIRAKKDNVAKDIPIPLQISAIGVTAYIWETWCGTPFFMDEIGKTVFLTLEEAEKALKAKEGE